MVVKRAINVGFHSDFGTLKRSRYALEGSLSHSLSTCLILQD